ncbi:MAG: ATP-dependent Clp protease adaptor ClpS [Bacteroidales bacterium]|nr:ATP-dependent Clp protease adaptor ClpS [Bacteroidales bacterium]
MPTPKTKGGSSLKEITRISLDEPKMYHVLLHNDDITTMEFVVMILTQVFCKSEPAAQEIMLKVHRNGSAIVGTYSYDVALSRQSKASALARKEGYPLNITIEQAQ